MVRAAARAVHLSKCSPSKDSGNVPTPLPAVNLLIPTYNLLHLPPSFPKLRSMDRREEHTAKRAPRLAGGVPALPHLAPRLQLAAVAHCKSHSMPMFSR